jgi:hypothetical protein
MEGTGMWLMNRRPPSVDRAEMYRQEALDAHARNRDLWDRLLRAEKQLATPIRVRRPSPTSDRWLDEPLD